MPLGNSFGYPVATADELGLTEYFRKNPKVAGMAWGGGMNGSPRDQPRVLVANPFNAQIAKPEKMQGLLKIEAARHLMDETGYTPEFDLSEEQQEWRKNLGKYADDDIAAKRSIVSRLIANDNVPGVTPEQRAEVEAVNKALQGREPDFVKEVMSGLNLRGMQQESEDYLNNWLDRRDVSKGVEHEIDEGVYGSFLGIPAGTPAAIMDEAPHRIAEAKDALKTKPTLLEKPLNWTEGEWLNIQGMYYPDEVDPKIAIKDTGSDIFAELDLALEDQGLKKSQENVMLHEMVHHADYHKQGAEPDIRFGVNQNKELRGKSISGNLDTSLIEQDDKYLRRPEEVVARMFVLRKEAGLKPDAPATNEVLDNFLLQGGKWNDKSLPGFHDPQIHQLWRTIKGESYEKKRNNLRTLLNSTVSVQSPQSRETT